MENLAAHVLPQRCVYANQDSIKYMQRADVHGVLICRAPLETAPGDLF